MNQINIIPDKIPKIILRKMRKGQCDEIILFALAVYGPLDLKEFINDIDKSINNRMDENLFNKWAEDLKKNMFIEEFKKGNDIFYRITALGENKLISRLEKYSFVKQVVKAFKSNLSS